MIRDTKIYSYHNPNEAAWVLCEQCRCIDLVRLWHRTLQRSYCRLRYPSIAGDLVGGRCDGSVKRLHWTKQRKLWPVFLLGGWEPALATWMSIK